MSTLTLTKADVIFQFGSPKKTTYKAHINNAPSKTFKKYAFGTTNLKYKTKLQLIRIYKNMVQF
jgi:hypothetical protein